MHQRRVVIKLIKLCHLLVSGHEMEDNDIEVMMNFFKDKEEWEDA